MNYQLIVIGSGPGGYVAAIKAAQLGMKTAIVEKGEVGGTCLNRGCIPTKALMEATEFLRGLKKGEDLGITINNITYDFVKIQERKNTVVETLKSGIASLLQGNKVDVIAGHAKILDTGKIEVDGKEYGAEHIIIASGSKPVRIPIEGVNHPDVVTSDELLFGEGAFYKHLTIIGGGVIGMEFASIYNALGVEVTVIEAANRILPMLDREIAQNLSMILKKRGVSIFTGAKVNKIADDNGTLKCSFIIKDKEQIQEADGILLATGRSANTENLFSEDLNMELERGYISVDKNFETKIKNIYAIGDVVKGNIQLAHVASAQGVHVVSQISGNRQNNNLDIVPSCVYTSPEIATVGISEEEAKEQNIDVVTGKYIMSGNGKSIISNADRGFIKLVFSSENGVLLGAHLMCERATDMISELSLAIANKLTAKEITSIIRPHPTFNEGVTEAAELYFGNSIHTMPRRKK